jgi:hypothetical protein
LLVLAFKTQMPVHIADGSSVTRTLTTWRKMCLYTGNQPSVCSVYRVSAFPPDKFVKERGSWRVQFVFEALRHSFEETLMTLHINWYMGRPARTCSRRISLFFIQHVLFQVNSVNVCHSHE